MESYPSHRTIEEVRSRKQTSAAQTAYIQSYRGEYKGKQVICKLIGDRLTTLVALFMQLFTTISQHIDRIINLIVSGSFISSSQTWQN